MSQAALVGDPLYAVCGRWSPIPTSIAYQWQRGAIDGTGFVNIGGATGRGYIVVTADSGHSVRCMVAATTAGGTSTAASDYAVVAAAGQPATLPAIQSTLGFAASLGLSAGSTPTPPGGGVFVAKQWVSELNPLGPPTDASIATPISGAALTDLETRLAAYTDQRMATRAPVANAVLVNPRASTDLADSDNSLALTTTAWVNRAFAALPPSTGGGTGQTLPRQVAGDTTIGHNELGIVETVSGSTVLLPSAASLTTADQGKSWIVILTVAGTCTVATGDTRKINPYSGMVPNDVSTQLTTQGEVGVFTLAPDGVNFLRI